MSESKCYVSGEDYALHWYQARRYRPQPAIWVGDERRLGITDRRRKSHERRWEKSRGRRFRLTDRRRG